MPTYKFIDLFAGLGGFHLALEQLGCKCVFASELQQDLRTLYESNFGMKCAGDINLINIEKDIPSHDILCGGFPCQPFSQAGKQQGFQDEKERGNLFNKIMEVLEFHKPEFVFLENVPNLKSHDKGNTYRVIHEKLSMLYEVKEDIDEANMDRMRRKQAEFLVKDCVPVSCVAGIIVKTADREAYVKTILSRLSIEIPIYVDSKNNYFYP